MSIFGIDWNGDGNIDFSDTAIDAIILSNLKKEEESSSDDDDDSDD